jgi:ABC-type transport system involved in multi-copper enzyme maturation permease subunit
MTAESTRTLKEARALLFPWCAVMILCTFQLFTSRGQFLNFVFQAGFTVGVPLLACLSFGHEFRHKTMELLVTQPVSRLKIWREKSFVVATAILTLSVVAILCSRTPVHLWRPEDLDYAMFLVITTCSAAFWTLFAKSTLGGLMLNIAIVVPLGLAKFAFWEWNVSAGHFSNTGGIFVLSAAALGYSAGMLWLGKWILIRRQSGAGFAGSDLMVAIPSLMPRRIAGLLQCRRNQAVLNLIRKELQLLRPLWLLSVLYVLGWSAIAISLSFVSSARDSHQAMLVILVIGTASYPMVAMFLGAVLPFAEEGGLGIQLWHLTLPLSIKTQCLTRLMTGLLAGLFCGIGLTSVLTSLAKTALGPDIVREMDRIYVPFHTSYLLMFFAFIFWCAVIARDMPRTAALAGAAGALLGVAYRGGQLMATWTGEIFGKLARLVISGYQLNPSAFHFSPERFPDLFRLPEWILAIAMCAVMSFHSYRLFRRLPRESALKLIRPLVPYLAVIVIFVCLTSIRLWNGGWSAEFDLYYDIEKAIVAVQPPKSFTVEDLTRVAALSNDTRRWLRNSNMSLTVTDDPDPYGIRRKYSHGNWKVYRLTIQLPNGTACKAKFPAAADGSRRFFFSPGKCD